MNFWMLLYLNFSVNLNSGIVKFNFNVSLNYGIVSVHLIASQIQTCLDNVYGQIQKMTGGLSTP